MMDIFPQDPQHRRLRKIRRQRMSLLKDWYGEEFSAAEIAAHISQPHTMQTSIRAVMAQLEKPEERALRQLRAAWPKTAGEVISRFAVPAEWHDGILTIEVRHSALLRELKPSLELLREAIGKQIPDCACTEIRVSISGGAGRMRTGHPTQD